MVIETAYFMTWGKLLHRIEGCVWSYQSWYGTSHVMMKVYDATSRMMTKVGGGA